MEDMNYDGGGQLMGPFDNYLQDCGIAAQYIVLNMSEQNGVAEKRNKLLQIWSEV